MQHIFTTFQRGRSYICVVTCRCIQRARRTSPSTGARPWTMRRRQQPHAMRWRQHFCKGRAMVQATLLLWLQRGAHRRQAPLRTCHCACPCVVVASRQYSSHFIASGGGRFAALPLLRACKCRQQTVRVPVPPFSSQVRNSNVTAACRIPRSSRMGSSLFSGGRPAAQRPGPRQWRAGYPCLQSKGYVRTFGAKNECCVNQR